LPRFGAKTEDALLEGIRRLEDPQEEPLEETLLVDAIPLAQSFADYLRTCPGITQVEVAGDVRRWRESVRSIELAVAAEPLSKARDGIDRFPEIAQVEVREPEHIALRLAGAGRIDIHVAPPARFANALLRSTGSAAHVAKLEAIASSLSTSIDAAAAREA